MFVFSHIESTTQEKCFPSSLSVNDIMLAHRTMKYSNLEALQEATILKLVTGHWAQHVNLNSFTLTDGRCPPPKYATYDHLQRLNLSNGSSKHCSELTSDYKALQYHSTLSHYTQGDDHSWRLFSVVPMLSDTVILPRVLDPNRVKAVMASFARATRKSIRDSLIVAGTTKYKESTWLRVEERGILSSCAKCESEMVDQQASPLDAPISDH
jgi:hypothetical protein